MLLKLLFLASIGITFIGNLFLNQSINLFIVLLITTVAMICLVYRQKYLQLPRQTTIVYSLFFGLYILSAFKSTNHEATIRLLLTYYVLFLIYIIVVNVKGQIKFLASSALVGVGIISIILFLFDKFMVIEQFKNPFSLFYPNYEHHQIGNLMVLSIISIFPSVRLWFFLPFLFISLSRTAYIALTITLIYIFQRVGKYKNIIIGILIILVIGLVSTFFHNNKTILGGRHLYINYAVKAIITSPIYGVGPGNFFDWSYKQQLNYGQLSASSHNLILDILAENGLIAGGLFLVFIIYGLIRSSSIKITTTIIAILSIFMFDASHQHLFFMVILFIFLALNNQDQVIKSTLIPNSLIIINLMLIIFIIVVYNLNITQQHEKLVSIYPFQRSALEKVIENNLSKDSYKALKYIYLHNKLFKSNRQAIFKRIFYYNTLDMKREVLNQYVFLINNYRLIDYSTWVNVIYYHRYYYGKKQGEKIIYDTIKKILENNAGNKDSVYYRDLYNIWVNLSYL